MEAKLSIAKFESVPEFVQRVKTSYPTAKKITCLFHKYMFSKFEKIVIKPSFIIVDKQKCDISANWIDTSVKKEYVMLKYGEAYELIISTKENHLTIDGKDCVYHHQLLQPIHSTALKNKVLAVEDEDLLSIL